MAGDIEHAQSKYINAKIEDLAHIMSQQGYSPGLHLVSQKIVYAAKAHLLCRHSKKLASVCALINTILGKWICDDCLAIAAFIPKTVIVVNQNVILDETPEGGSTSKSNTLGDPLDSSLPLQAQNLKVTGIKKKVLLGQF